MTSKGSFPWESSLDLRPGEEVEVRSKEEILATLDRRGRLDGMPFMPEMLQFCGKRLRVLARAEKSCDTVLEGKGRQVYDAVHLADARCDGSSHGGCQARCLIWWREAWLRRVDGSCERPDPADVPEPVCTEEDLERHTSVKNLTPTIYSCQATRQLDFTYGLRWWDPRPVIREIRGGNVTIPEAARVIGRAALNIFRRKTGRRPEPHVRGRCESGTPEERIPDLEPGDWVRVKSKNEIERTLDRGGRNRGLLFDVEMVPYCGRTFRVLEKVERIIDEPTGAMRTLPNDCWILEGVVCSGKLSRNRLFCTRRIYPFWREIWLEKVDGPDAGAGNGTGGAACEGCPAAAAG